MARTSTAKKHHSTPPPNSRVIDVPPAPESMSDVTDVTTASTTAPPRPALTAREKKDLFVVYDRANSAVAEAEAALALAIDARSKAVEAIYVSLGPGKWEWKGQELQATYRTDPKNPEKAPIFFMRSTRTVAERIG